MILGRRKIFSQNNNALVAGPFVGEFGWELMEWQGYIRKLSRKYDTTVSISYNSSKYLYETCEFFAHNFSLERSGYGYGKCEPEEMQRIVERAAEAYGLSEYDVIQPVDLHRINRILFGKQIFRKFCEDSNERLDIVFSFRDMLREDGNEKNYEKKNIQPILDYCDHNGLRYGFIGLPQYSYCPNDKFDLRSTDLKETIAHISSSALVVGGSSGPMHLASLCGKPIVVWTGAPSITRRYFAAWNPFAVSVYVVTENTFNPSPEAVIETIRMALDETRTSQVQKESRFKKLQLRNLI